MIIHYSHRFQIIFNNKYKKTIAFCFLRKIQNLLKNIFDMKLGIVIM